MSKTADKKAQKAEIKRRWNSGPVLVAPPPPKPTSWWLSAASPDAREKFIELAKERDGHEWTNIVPHATNPRNEMS